MTVVESSRVRVASFYVADLVLGTAFPLLFFLAIEPAEHIPVWFKSVFGLAAIFGMVVLARALHRIARTLRADGLWRATLTDDRLLWEVAIPSKDFPVDIALSDIAEAVQTRTVTLGSNQETTVTTTFELRLTDGGVRSISQDTAGINPHRVFLALKKHGIPYSLWEHDKTIGHENEKRSTHRNF